jgi:hypothetical protein
MQQFKIRQDGFKEIKKQMLVRTIPIILIVATGGIVISSVNSKNKADDINVLPYVIPLIAVSVGFGLYRGVNRQKGLFESYTLTFTSNLITREQLNTPTISIYFNDIYEIIKNRNGSFTIRGKGVTDIISVPTQIENYPQLQETLSQLKSISTKSNDHFLQKYRSILAIFAVGLMVCVYTLTNKIIVALSGALLVGLMLWSFFEVYRSKNIDSKTKRGMWWVLLVLASVIGVMVMKLTGQQNK